MGKVERVCKCIYNNIENYNLAQDIESKLAYISIINNYLEFLATTSVIDRYRILRDENDNEKISKIVLEYKGFGTIEIIAD